MADSFPPHHIHVQQEEGYPSRRSRHLRSGASISTRGVSFGLLPFFLIVAALLMLVLSGYQCGTMLINVWIEIAGLLWIGELLTGIFSLFRQQARRFAMSFVVTLFLSALLTIPLFFLAAWFVSHGVHPFCFSRS
jgi:hypothetical protein